MNTLPLLPIRPELRRVVLHELGAESQLNPSVLPVALEQAERLVAETPYPGLLLPVLAAELAWQFSHLARVARASFAPASAAFKIAA